MSILVLVELKDRSVIILTFFGMPRLPPQAPSRVSEADVDNPLKRGLCSPLSRLKQSLFMIDIFT